MEAAGRKFYNRAGAEQDLFQLLRDDYGLNAIRLRVWVNPPVGYNGAADVLAKARPAQALGRRLLIDFHYSNTWARPRPANQACRLAKLQPGAAQNGRVRPHDERAYTTQNQRHRARMGAGVYPSPTTGPFFGRGPDGTGQPVAVYALGGQLLTVLTPAFAAGPGPGRYALPATLPPGVYVLRIGGAGATATARPLVKP